MKGKKIKLVPGQQRLLSYFGHEKRTSADDASMKRVLSDTRLVKKEYELSVAASSETSPRPQAQADSKHRDGSSTNALGSIDLISSLI